MTTFLERVREEKRVEVASRKELTTPAALRSQAREAARPISWLETLERLPGQGLRVIAEVKARAPGRENVSRLDLPQLVRDYEAGGARALSVLTDEKHFGGSLATLAEVAQLSRLPLLQKEFIVDPYQVWEGRVRGASAVLVLVAYYPEQELRELVEEIQSLGMTAVVECSLPEELPRALVIQPQCLLLNNRPIAALPADARGSYLEGSVEVGRAWWHDSAPLRRWKNQSGRVLISASCIQAPAEIRLLAELPFDAALVGNAAMSAPDRAAFLRSLCEAGDPALSLSRP